MESVFSLFPPRREENQFDVGGSACKRDKFCEEMKKKNQNQKRTTFTVESIPLNACEKKREKRERNVYGLSTVIERFE